jgi:tripartite-type tricarboxylate transporter receptor subunit TctC
MALPVLLIAAGALCPLPVLAWPERPVTLVIPFAPGGAADAAMRVIGPRLSRHLGHPVVVENKPGAGGVVGTQFVARATGDGHTQLVGSAGNAITSALSTQLPYDFEKDLLPVTQIASVPGVLVVQSSLPVKSVKDLVALLKAEPGARSFGSPGQGTSVHMAGELFQHMTGTRMLHVPYRGASNALTDLLGGQLDLMLPPRSPTSSRGKCARLPSPARRARRSRPTCPPWPRPGSPTTKSARG